MKRRIIAQHVIERGDGKPKITVLGADDSDQIDLAVHTKGPMGQNSVTTQLNESEVGELREALTIHLASLRSHRQYQEMKQDYEENKAESDAEDDTIVNVEVVEDVKARSGFGDEEEYRRIGH